MNRVPLNGLTKPLLGVVIITCFLPCGGRADVMRRAGCGCNNGGGGTQHAARPSINGCVQCEPHQSCDPRATNGHELLTEDVLPQGTLGRTYTLPSRPVPADTHPRVAMIDVCSSSAAHVIVRWTNDFRTEETLKGYQDEYTPSVWHFESKPLLPGLARIYRVEVYQGGPGSSPTETYYVRLIMGRIVYLTL